MLYQQTFRRERKILIPIIVKKKPKFRPNLLLQTTIFVPKYSFN